MSQLWPTHFLIQEKGKHSEEESFECDNRKLRCGVRAAQLDSDSTQSTLCESSMVTRIRNRMGKGRLVLKVVSVKKRFGFASDSALNCVRVWTSNTRTLFFSSYLSATLPPSLIMSFKKCLNVRQKLGTRKTFKALKLSHSHSLSVDILNNFYFHVYAHSLTLTIFHFHYFHTFHPLIHSLSILFVVFEITLLKFPSNHIPTYILWKYGKSYWPPNNIIIVKI